jgi:hypothetical protein
MHERVRLCCDGFFFDILSNARFVDSKATSSWPLRSVTLKQTLIHTTDGLETIAPDARVRIPEPNDDDVLIHNHFAGAHAFDTYH